MNMSREEIAIRPARGAARDRRRRMGGVVLFALLGLASCATDRPAPRPPSPAAQVDRPPGSVYAGWRVFQDRCAKCHGAAGSGTEFGPDLLPRVAEMSSRRFVNLVLQRYDWSMSAGEAGSASAARESLIEDVLQRREIALAMPAWQSEPGVNAHILDLYAYLSARADGAQGPGRPTP